MLRRLRCQGVCGLFGVVILLAACVADGRPGGAAPASASAQATTGGVPAQKPFSACVPDKAAMLGLDQQVFNEDAGRGWQSLPDDPACSAAYAELIGAFIRSRPQDEAIDKLLFANEGVLWAKAGRRDEAVRALDASRPPDDEARNAYLDAVIAFLREDRTALADARERLLAVPPPPGFTEAADAFENETGVKLTWPLDLPIVDGLLACFGKPFVDAYQAPECLPA